MNHKIAGLYLNLAKALNALEEAGESINFDEGDSVSGWSGAARWDPETERWNVAQA